MELLHSLLLHTSLPLTLAKSVAGSVRGGEWPWYLCGSKRKTAGPAALRSYGEALRLD